MSDLSLLTGVYASVASYAALIDKVIERLRAEVGSDSSGSRSAQAWSTLD